MNDLRLILPNAVRRCPASFVLVIAAALCPLMPTFALADEPVDAPATPRSVDQLGPRLLERFAGEWRLKATRASGQTISGQNVYTPTLGGEALRVTTFVTRPDGTTYQRYDRLMWFDQEAGLLRTLGLGYDIRPREQAIEIVDGDTLRIGFDDPDARARETYAFEGDDRIAWQVEVLGEDGAWSIAVSGVWYREQGSTTD